jgi:hypothetical protein
MTYLCLDGWAGRREVPVAVLSRNGKYSRVRLLENALVPRKGHRLAGEVVRVPTKSLKVVEGDKEIRP